MAHLCLGQRCLHDLVDERAAEWVFVPEDFCPEFHVATADQIPGLGLEQRVLVADGDQLPVALAALVSHAGQVRVSLLAVTAHNFAVVKLVLPGNRGKR